MNATIDSPASDSRQNHDNSRKLSNWFATALQPHESEVRGYLRSHFPSVDVDDVVQESYLKLWRHRNVDAIVTSRAYFFSTARNTALTLIRRRKLYSDTALSDLPSWRVIDDETDTLEKIDRNQQSELLLEAIDHLPNRCRVIVGLSAVEGVGNREIAARLRLSESTIRVQIARGIRKIVQYIHGLYPECCSRGMLGSKSA